LSPGQANRHVFTEEGGLIGRSSRVCAWVLSRDQVSGKHARISFQKGVFYIEDMSTNGVAVNTPENRLVKGRPYALKHGDQIFIDPYEMGVSISGGAVGREADPFGTEDPFAPGLVQSGSPMFDSPVDVVSGGEVDPMRLIGPPIKPGPH